MKPNFVGQLEAFRATVTCGTVSGAAELLGISQPAVSRAILRLEANLGVTLFDRRKGRLASTREALILFDHVERSFASFDKVREIAAEIRGARTGRLHIAAMPAVCAGFLPNVICSFKRDHPDVAITVQVQHSTKVEDWIFSQFIDFGVAEFPLQREGLQSETFCRVPMYLVTRLDHRLAARDVVGPRDLVEEPLITLMPGQVGRRNVDDAFLRQGFSKSPALESQNYPLICELVLGGLGVAIVDPFTAVAYRGRGLAMIPFSPVVEFHIGLLQPEHRPLSRAASSFLAVLRKHRMQFLAQLPRPEGVEEAG